MRAAWHFKVINQGLLQTKLHCIFPQYEIISNARQEAAVKNPITSKYLEVDVWVPELNLCFEFQDDYHFKSAWYSHVPLSLVQQKDNTKRNQLLERGLTLISVPYWWDGTVDSLHGTIHFHRPDILKLIDTTIPASPPIVLFSGYKELMLASFPENTNLEVAGKAWWVGEKWDGVRCFWSVSDRQLYSRNNICIDLHPNVSDLLGCLVLDGELWCGRSFFYESQTYTVSSWERLNNSLLRLVCFDEASTHTHQCPFEMRYAFLLENVSCENPVVVIAPRFLSWNEQTLLDSLQSIIESGGEGLILRLPRSRYIPGRSESLFKIKASQNDQEALVVKVENDGSLLLQLPTGFLFPVSKEDCTFFQRAVRGDIVTFAYDFSRRARDNNGQKTNLESLWKIPSNPVVHRIRTDLSWEDVISSAYPRWLGNEAYEYFKSGSKTFWDYEKHKRELAQDELYRKYFPETDPRATALQSWQLHSQRRGFFDRFAASKGMNPENPVFWYGITTQELMGVKGYKAIANYGGSLPTLLMQLYPDIGLQKSCFYASQSWKFAHERKAFFDRFAAARGMDALNPVFWYKITSHELMRYGMAFRVILSYHRTLAKALMQLYPNIGLKKAALRELDVAWQRRKDRIQFFNNFAASKGGDPLNPDFWYNITTPELKSYDKRYTEITNIYSGKLKDTLLRLYPNIGLQKSKFLANESWISDSAKKKFFDKFAAARGMDPLNPVFWYTVTTAQLVSFDKRYRSILNHYGGKLSTLLMLLYPKIGLKRHRFHVRSSWQDESDRRAYFDKFAELRGMDPLNPVLWYNTTVVELQQYRRGYDAISGYYDYKLSSVLMHLYPNIGLEKSKFKSSSSGTG